MWRWDDYAQVGGKSHSEKPCPRLATVFIPALLLPGPFRNHTTAKFLHTHPTKSSLVAHFSCENSSPCVFLYIILAATFMVVRGQSSAVGINAISENVYAGNCTRRCTFREVDRAREENALSLLSAHLIFGAAPNLEQEQTLFKDLRQQDIEI